jgi:hypothetical protein
LAIHYDNAYKGFTYIAFTYNINKCLLFTVVSKTVISKVFYK